MISPVGPLAAPAAPPRYPQTGQCDARTVILASILSLLTIHCDRHMTFARQRRSYASSNLDLANDDLLDKVVRSAVDRVGPRGVLARLRTPCPNARLSTWEGRHG